MKNTLKISLRANEKIYLNGAVIRADRKVTIELMNDVQFLLESHVLQPQDAVTPLRQLYFMTQMMLMNPEGANEAREMFRKSLPLLLANFSNERIKASLKHVDQLVNEDHVYDALKVIRSLYPIEAQILGGETPAASKPSLVLVAGE
ncbi:flagellar biosynthesis repressor FlbT [Mesorhizobium sp. 1B3]|uniref:flagellar biosynthesis repressor FlbT n=1 Tax=Mesorhizobium sp. 1B3 TaxID=3243599 RepID=UPI003D97D918